MVFLLYMCVRILIDININLCVIKIYLNFLCNKLLVELVKIL